MTAAGTCFASDSVGVGDSILTLALGYARASPTIRFAPADRYLREMAEARVDRAFDKTCRNLLVLVLLTLDHLGLHRFDQQQLIHLYQLVIDRQHTASCVITSKRDIEEQLGPFDAPILVGSAPYQPANARYEIAIDGANCRLRLSLHRWLCEPKEVVDEPTAAGWPTI